MCVSGGCLSLYPFPQGRDINLDIGQIVGHRQFCNKLWQATQFVMMNLASYTHSGTMTDLIGSLLDLSGREQWILFKLNEAIVGVTTAMQQYQFSLACQAVYDFWQKDFCDNYIVSGHVGALWVPLTS